MHPRFPVAVLASASVLALSTAIHAQEAAPAEETVVLDTIVLTATSDTAVAADGYVARYGQAATKSDTPIAETQQSVSVVTNQQIVDQNAQTLGQALSYTAGVVGEPYGADPRFDSPTIRGFEARDAQYVNGLRQLRYMGAPAYETYGLQQVEVLRGPSSSLYGAGAPAGIVNQVQKRAQDSDFAEVGLGYDNNHGSQLFFDVNRAASDTLSYRLTGVGRDARQQIEEVKNERGYLAGALRWKPSEDTTIDVIASYTKDEPISPTGVPYELTRIGRNEDLRDLDTGEGDWDESDRKMYNLGFEISHQLDNGWTLSQGFRYEKFDWEYSGTYVSGLSADGTQILRGANRQIEDTKGINLDTRLAGEVETGGMIHRLLFGLDIRQFDANATTEFYTGTPLAWANPVRGSVPAGPAWYTAISDIKQRQIGLYVQDEIEVGNWRGTVALRHDWAKQTGTKYTNFAGTNGIDQSDQETTGHVGLGYRFDNGMMPYVSYSTSFDPVIGIDENGDTMKPMRATSWEAGLKYEPTNFDGLFTVAYYDMRQKNVTRNLGNGIIRQLGKVKSRGLELEGTAQLDQGWDLRGSYSYNKTEQVGGTENGNEMPNAPEHTANLWVEREWGNGFRVGGGVRYIGNRKGDFANVYDLDDVTLLDLGASYTRDNIEARLNVANLTDKVYVANCGSFGCFYGEGRTVTAKVSYKW